MKNKKITIAIVAHVDHGKSTLCDAIISECINKDISSDTPTLDSHLIEKMRGVTIRNHFIRLNYKDEYILNIIDTPGHSDLACFVEIGIYVCRGIILLIDVTKGIQAQTYAYLKLCQKYSKKVIIALNKIDLGINDHIKEIYEKLNQYTNITEIIKISAKDKTNIKYMLQSTIKSFPLEEIKEEDSLSFIIIDYKYNQYHGNILFVYIKSGKIQINDYIKIDNKKYLVCKIEYKDIQIIQTKKAISGDLCYLYLDINIQDSKTILGLEYNNNKLIRSIILPEPMIHTNIYTIKSEDFYKIESITKRLQKSEHGITMKSYNSKIYGSIMRLGFYGSFHKDIFLQKLYLETKIKFNTTSSDIEYLDENNKKIITLDVKKLKDNYKHILKFKTPVYLIYIQSHYTYYNRIISYIKNYIKYYIIKHTYFQFDTAIIYIEIPIYYIENDLLGILQGLTNGYTEIIIDQIKYIYKKLSLIEFLINKEVIDELSFIEISELAEEKGIEKAKEISSSLTKQQFKLVLNVSVDRRIIYKDIIQPFRKDVEHRCNGGDATRRKKLLKKQKEGKIRILQNSDINKIKQSIIKNIVTKHNL